MLFLAVNLSAQTITTQPTNQIVTVGNNVTFSVVVSGTGPFSYQWQFNGTNLPPNGIITTVAGNGNYNFSGDGGAATNAAFAYPAVVVVDGNGNLFIADRNNNRIRKVNVSGIITTVVGSGSGFSGDGGAATNAALNQPWGVAVDNSGNLFIVDRFNNRIRKVDTNGIITTVAGNGSSSFSGDGGAATNAALNYPFGVAVDAGGNLFIADTSNNRIRRVDANGIIMTVAGNGTNSFFGDGGAATNAALNYPFSIAVDAGGNLFIADYNNSRIRKVDANGIIATVAGNGINNLFLGDGGAATNAALAYPSSVAVDAIGNLFIADFVENRIRQVDTNGIIATVAGNGINYSFSGDGGAATNAALYDPESVAVDAGGNLFIADQGNNRIRKVQNNPQKNLPTLVLSNVTINNTGNYSVVVSGSGGSVTSSIVTLTVLVSSSFAAPKMLANGKFQFSFDTTTGVNYTVQYSTNLLQWYSWVTFGGIGAPLTLTDPNTANSQQRFYRISLSPR